MNTEKMPVIFAGHGTPMNAVETNEASLTWKHLKNKFKKPKAIIAVSAHWSTDRLYISSAEKNKQIFDMEGFPKKLYEVKYRPKGSFLFADKARSNLSDIAEFNNDWGVVHGVWEILCNMYPKADIPVVMMSCNIAESERFQFQVGEKLKSLREEGALILASGNIVHNLGLLSFSGTGEDWAINFNRRIKESVLNKDYETAINYRNIEFSDFAVPTPEHYYPLLTALGAVDNDSVEIFNDYFDMGAVSMTSFIWRN